MKKTNNNTAAIRSFLNVLATTGNQRIDSCTLLHDSCIKGTTLAEFMRDTVPVLSEELRKYHGSLAAATVIKYLAAACSDDELGGSYVRAAAKVVFTDIAGEYTASHKAAVSRALTDGQKSKRSPQGKAINKTKDSDVVSSMYKKCMAMSANQRAALVAMLVEG
tara:strand:+ start:2304 stop:2795 length:492 start_codon:yes stop_codon:yes gene_type:complete